MKWCESRKSRTQDSCNSPSSQNPAMTETSSFRGVTRLVDGVLSSPDRFTSVPCPPCRAYCGCKGPALLPCFAARASLPITLRAKTFCSARHNSQASEGPRCGSVARRPFAVCAGERRIPPSNLPVGHHNKAHRRPGPGELVCWRFGGTLVVISSPTIQMQTRNRDGLVADKPPNDEQPSVRSSEHASDTTAESSGKFVRLPCSATSI
jgi:hypothetical protein